MLIPISKTHLWNKPDNEVIHSISIVQFKNKLLSIIRPMGNSIYNINDVIGVRYVTKLRLQFSALNEHKLRHNFDCLSPFCICGTAKEDNEHFLLHCPLYYEMRCDLLDQISEIPGLDISQYNLKSFCTLLLYGSPLSFFPHFVFFSFVCSLSFCFASVTN